jgi:diaminopimelate decarboxylase/aspartate kinase
MSSPSSAGAVPSAPVVVLKFGGTSVATVRGWDMIADAVRAVLAEGARPVLVCSALAGVSDRLSAALDAVGSVDREGSAENVEVEAVVAALRGQHHRLAADAGVALPASCSALLEDLGQLLQGLVLVGEVSPRSRARVMAHGELLSTRLGVALLAARGLQSSWQDARQALCSHLGTPAPSPERRYLSAHCSPEQDPALAERFGAALAEHDLVLTQGFIAADPETGHTVLLGRGGSDTSAAVFAARLGARSCDIWTDVPGMFTANPRAHATARLLEALDYAEALEIASTGAKVLHPRAIAPVRAHGIALRVRSTLQPELQGTVVQRRKAAGPLVKAVSSRRGIVLVSMETVGMWQQVGFLARAFACFSDAGLSVDLVATSETNVTVSLDPSANALEAGVLARLKRELDRFCEARILRDCTSVSLVGRGIRSILHRLSGAFELFEEQRVHLLSQAANDLNLTVVVDSAQASRLEAQLHALVLQELDGVPGVGPSWAEIQEERPEAAARAVRPEQWWERRREELLALVAAPASTPRYVYDGPTVDAAAQGLMGLGNAGSVLYAVKANAHEGLLRRIVAVGLGLECVSPGEVRLARRILDEAGSAAPLLFTPNFAPRREYAEAYEHGARVTLDNLHPLAAWPEVFAGRDVFVRLDPGAGAGHHAKVRTAGTRSKFGVALHELDELLELAARHAVRITGLHAHVGSGVRDPAAWLRTGRFLAGVVSRIPTVEVLDLGGGLGVPVKPGQKPLDLDRLDAVLGEVQALVPGCQLWLEPGRYLVAQGGVLLARVTQRKRKGPLHYVGVDAGMNTLIRPALYGAWHEIRNLSRLHSGEPAEEVDVVGPICETGDVLGRARRIVPAQEGDVLLIGNAGAYGRSMSSRYNLREPAVESVLD